MPTIMKATHNAEDPRFTFSNRAQGFSPGVPNPGAPISPLHALDGGNAYGNMGRFPGSNTFEGGGQPVMNMSNSERQRSRSYSSPYGNPELDYVYLGSPKSLSPFLTPGFSLVSNNASHALQPAQGNAFVGQHPFMTAPVETSYLAPAGNSFRAPLHPAQRFSGGAVEPLKAQVQPPVAAHELYPMPTQPELIQYDYDVWANLEAVLLGQESAQHYDGMVDSTFGFDPAAASMPAPGAASQAHPGGSGGNSADCKSWAMLSEALPDGVDGSSSRQSKPSTRRDGRHELAAPPRPAHNSNDQGLYPLAEFQGNSLIDMMDMVTEDRGVSDGVSGTENSSHHEVMYTQIPSGYAVQPTPSSSTTTGLALGHARSSRPENDFRDPQQEQAQSYNASPGRTFNESVMTNDFIQLLSPSLLGTGHLGEPCWALQLLNLCAAAIASQNITRTQHLMCVLNDLASVQGDVNQRFAAYGLKALFCRITDNDEAASTFARPRHNEQETSFGSDRVHRALVRFHDYVPWHQNCYTASSQTLLEVCAGKSRLHLIDIGAGKGIEWPIFIDALVSRAGGPPSILRITMIRDLRREEHKIRYAKLLNTDAADFMTRLVKFASVLGLHVEVNMVTKALECVTREDLRLRHGEILAVVCQFRLHRLMEEVPERPTTALPSRPPLAPRDEFLDFIFTLNPHVFILSENNSDHSSHDFLTRFQIACNYWWHFYESLDMGYNGKDPEERQILEFEAGTVMLNQVACEGMRRIERNEPYHVWARRVKRAGFVPKELSDDTKKACQALVHNHSEFWDITFDESNMVNLRWRKLDTTFTSVWATPGSCSKPSCKCSMLHN